MAATQKKTLFNDPTLSDVKIKQICKGKTREYFGHKAILCTQSDFFMKAFTGGFKEATAATIEIHDDDPDHFEFALKFIYTLNYEPKTVEPAPGKDDQMKRAYFAMGVHVIADKYGIERLFMPIASNLEAILLTVQQTTALMSFVETYYKNCLRPGTMSGIKIVSTLLRTHHGFSSSTEFTRLCQSYPVFSADIMSTLVRFACTSCTKTNIVRPTHPSPTATHVTCAYCRTANFRTI